MSCSCDDTSSLELQFHIKEYHVGVLCNTKKSKAGYICFTIVGLVLYSKQVKCTNKTLTL